MPIEITVPRLGWSMEEGIFSAWLRNEGELVQPGEPLFAVESEKVTMDVESLDKGVLHIPSDAPKPGEVVAVGQRLGYLLVNGEAAPHQEGAANINFSPLTASKNGDLRVDLAPVAQETPAGARRIPISPRALGLANRLGIDTTLLRPREGAKRIVEADVQRAYDASKAAPAPSKMPASNIRKVIAARLEESFRTPHFYVHGEANATALVKLRDELVAIYEAERGIRLTYNDLLIKAIALALRESPGLNCYWIDTFVVSRTSINVGLAVQANDSLLVPVIRDADRLSLVEIAVARKELVDRCSQGAIRMEDLEDGSVTLSNLGAFGVDRFQAILNPPQSAIIAAGSIAKRPVVEGDAVVARTTIPLSVSVDHRVVDGVAAAAFLKSIVARIESPLRLAL